MGTVTKDPSQLEGVIRTTRAELDDTLSELRGAMSVELDWRTWVARHPWPALGLAALFGMRLGRGRWF